MARPEGVLDAAAARRLVLMRATAIDAARAVAVKRNVHEVDIDVDADRFAAALRAAMADPSAAFGLVRLRRLADRVGRDFIVGERFCGCFSLRRAAAAWGAPRWLVSALDVAGRAGVLDWIENRLTSDHAEIIELELGGGAGATHRVAYRYLDGTPLAGTSRYTITPLGAEACRLEVAFEYQETTSVAVELLHRFGIRQHDLAVLAQAEAAATRAGGRILRHTIPTGPAPRGRRGGDEIGACPDRVIMILHGDEAPQGRGATTKGYFL